MPRKTTIFDAIASGDPTRVKRTLTRAPEALAERDADDLTPVMRAVYDGKAEIVDVLLACDPELDVHEAAAVGQADTVRRLVGRSRRRTTAYSLDGFTPLHLAAFFGHSDVAEILLARGADVDARSRNKHLSQLTPLHSAAAGRRNTVAELLLDRGANPDAAQPGGWTPLHQAAASGNLDLCRVLLQAGATRTVMADDRSRPIDFAIEAGHREVVALLQGGG